jgi:glycosyltransferase involved in cell wall biosynthesis
MYGGPAARLAGVPSIWHHRDLVDLGSLGHWLYRLCSRVVAISDAVADDLIAQGIEGEKLVALTNGVDLGPWRPRGQTGSARAELGLGTGDVVFIMVAHLAPWKKHRLFLEAAALIAREMANARFLVVGDDLFGEHRDYGRHLRSLAQRLGLASKVIFTGHRQDIAPLVECSDLLVHPADREPFGRTLVEAMALGKPVVAIDACGPRQIVRHGKDGLLVPPEDPRALAQAALRVAGDPESARRMGRSGRERAARVFGIDRFRKGLEQLYDGVLKEAKHEGRD